LLLAAQQAEEKLAAISLYDAAYPEAAEAVALLRARLRASQLARTRN